VLSGGRGASAQGLPERAAAKAAVERLTRLQPDFPTPGVLFRDMSPLLADARGLWDVTLGLATAVPEEGIDLGSYIGNIERELIALSLERTNGNKGQAARLLNLNRTTLVEKLKRLAR